LNSLPDSFGLIDENSILDMNKLIHLDLSSNQLTQLPDSFDNLAHLEYLDLSINQIQFLPLNIGNLTKLINLNLSKNCIQILPDSIGRCTSLSKFNISFNNLEKMPSSIGNVMALEEIKASNNQLEKIPESMKQLSNLQSIDFSYNVIEQFPYELSSIHGLQHINLSNNRILGIEDDIQHFTHLLTLNLSGNRSNSNFYISSKIEELVNLQWLDLSDSYLSDEDLPPELFNLKKIRFLSLSHNGIKTIPENIKNLTNLVTLSLSNCPISSNITKSLCYLENLRSLNLSHNKELIYSWNGSEIIGEKPMTGDIPIEFLNLKNLISIDLSGTKLYTSSPTLEKFISERSITGWDNSLPELPERQPLSINYITTTSDNMGYSIHATIPIVIVFTQPVRLTNGNLMISLETGDTDHVIRIPSFSLSYTATGLYTVQEGDFSEDLNVKSIKLSDGASLTSENGDEINLLLADNMNLADMKNIHVDGTRPWINMTFPDTLCVKDIYTIKGESTDIAQNFLINLTVFDNQNNQVFQENQNFFGNTTEQWEFTPPQSIWQHNMTYSIQIDIRDFAGNTSRLIKDVTFGKKLSTISTHLTNNQIFLGQTARITGIISPAENVIGEEVTVKLRSPKGEILGRKVNANADGSFQYPLQCDDLHQAGIWYVSTAWEGTSCLESAVSNSIVMTVNHAPSQIVLDSTYSSVKMGDTVTITGKVISKYYCENHMNNIPILLEISGPEKSGHSEFISLETMDKLGSFQTNYSNFDVLGEWKLHAIIGEKTDFGIYSDAHAYTVSESLHINVVETAGYAIIVQGKITSEEGLASHNKTTNDVYHSLKQRGLLDEDILYFNYDNDQAFYKITDQTIAQLFDDDVPENIISLLKQEAIFNREYKSEAEFISKLASLDEQLLMYQSQILAHSSRGIEVDGLPTKNAIKKAIIADIPEIMGNKPANLYIVMVDHGTEDTFYIEPDIITDVELNEWLTELENTPGWNQEIILMLGFCFSGSFIDELSKPNRIIITSAGPDEFSYKGPLDQDNIREGEYFISEFFKSVALGKNIKASFSQAVIQTEMFTSIGDGSVNAPPFFDNSAQHPLLDDNGDKVGTNNVDDFDNDGNLSQDIIIGVSSLTMNDPGNVIVTEVSESIFLGPDENTTDKIMAKVSDDLRLLSLWIEIKPPNFVPNAVGSGQVEMNLPRIVYSRYDDATDCYQWNSESLLNIFDVPGTYHIYYFAKDINSKNVSPMKESIVYKASAVNHPPEPFNLLYPSNDIEITSLGVLAATSGTPTADSYTMISWEDTIDPDNDRLSYTLFFKKDNDQFDQGENRIKLSDLTNNFHEIQLPDEWDGSTIYWKVQAIDSYGAIQNSAVNRFMINNANNPSNGTLWGYVYDAATNKPVQRVGIAVKSGGSLIKRMMTMSTGKYFSAFRPLSNYHIVVEKEGYEVIEKSPVNVPQDDRCRLDFYLVADTSNIPQLSEISSQTINEGESFVPISLDNYITDGNNEIHEITWSASGNTELNVTIDDSRTASITVSNKDWFGAETIIFSAEDPEGNKGDTSATFTIKGVNDAPVVTNISDQIIYDYATFQPIILDNCVIDVDHAANEITWETMGQKNLMISINNRIATISLRDKQWRGYENIMFTATDPSGAFGVKMAMFTVLNSNFVYDLNNNGTIDLGDMIMVLQIFTNVYVDKEWISDQQIGFDDLLLIMNRLSR
jgi:Leucine-rich repeat (LRR) protein